MAITGRRREFRMELNAHKPGVCRKLHDFRQVLSRCTRADNHACVFEAINVDVVDFVAMAVTLVDGLAVDGGGEALGHDGAALGANIALLISDAVFRILMLIILPMTALYVFKKKDLFSGENRKELTFLHTVVLSSVIAFALGLYDGFYGPGTGTFLILLLTRFAYMDIHRANGITKVINLSSNISSLTVYLLSGQVLMPLGLCAGLFSILGNYLGSRCFTSKGASIARPIILLVLIVFFIRTALEMMGVM